MKILERSLQSIGKSLLVSLPKEWTSLLKLKKGSKVKISINEQGILQINPEFVKSMDKRTVSINYDKSFPRRFFREYFMGNEQITINFSQMSDSERSGIYSFIKRFLNAQIIEETGSRIVIKIFKIDELSIEECLRRMHYLSLNMIDEVINDNDEVKINELEESITRFYYMLVMQVRRFLNEGKYFEQEISLIRAMDYRMIAEKIERISDLLKVIKKIESKELMTKIKDYYSKSYNAFINSDFNKALELWNYHKKLKTNSIKMMQLIQYVKEISMLVR